MCLWRYDPQRFPFDDNPNVHVVPIDRFHAKRFHSVFSHMAGRYVGSYAQSPNPGYNSSKDELAKSHSLMDTAATSPPETPRANPMVTSSGKNRCRVEICHEEVAQGLICVSLRFVRKSVPWSSCFRRATGVHVGFAGRYFVDRDFGRRCLMCHQSRCSAL
ncbi:hypothetical protein ACRALDRAFT_2058532 [Sodiomyces alcalophilus JCM 7366]|uniref:uncharacterized protein n=1 Tax=Sodiomyces alcalophilus JCM 7366 TaxID=591952 RepID=UPI0039B55559